MGTDRFPVVLGFDGSASVGAAERWAIAEARSRAVPLRVVYGFSGPKTYATMSRYGNEAMAGNLVMPDAAALRAAAEQLLSDADGALHAAGADVEITTHAYEGDPVRVLLEQAHTASTLVLGTRGHGSLTGALLGSVSTSVSAQASCPVVVVRATADPTGNEPAPAGRTVVLGVQPDEDCEDVIAYAFDYANRHAVALTAVLCWYPDLVTEMMMRPSLPVPVQVEARLSEELAGWREKLPNVVVHESVRRAHPVAGLVAASADQHLLVVGTRRRSELEGLLLGSVSQGVLHHARCPVAIVPSAATLRQ